MKVSHHLHHALGVVIFAGVLIFCDAFSVAPVGLSGAYGGNGVHTRNDKAYGVSWSRNLDAEIQLRKQLCPQIPTHIGYQYRFHNETRSCYKLGERGPCGDNMIFFGYQSNAVYGQCDCNYNDNSRALIFDSKRNMCHFIYTRGYCNEGEWLSFSSTWEPICEVNKCLKFYENIDTNHNAIVPGVRDNRKSIKNQSVFGASLKAVSVEFVPYFGSQRLKAACVPLGLSCEDKDMDEKSFAQWASLAHLPHEVQFVKGKLTPRCVPSSEHIHWRYPTPKMQCLPGSFLMGVAQSNGKRRCDHQMEI